MRLFALFLSAATIYAADSIPNRAPLAPNTFQTLRLTSVKPRGWLLNELNLQAKGLSGHLDEFWPDLGPNSGWLGGTGESWERGPYFLDGLVPLAFLTQNPVLIAKVKKWLNWTLDHQTPAGWIGPTKNQDWWPNFVMLKVLTQYYEATGDFRVMPLMTKYFAYQAARLDKRPLKEWAVYRWQDEVLSILWLYNRTGNPALLDLARKLHSQGKDWNAQAADFPFKEKVSGPAANLDSHGVNNAQALKAAAVWSLITNKDEDRAAIYQMFKVYSINTTACPTVCSAPTNTSRVKIHRKASNSVQWSKPCSLSKRTSPLLVTKASPTVWKRSPTTRCPPPSRKTSGRISTTNSPTK
jgi:hypothetical protein